jgi:predicted amidohydrolase
MIVDPFGAVMSQLDDKKGYCYATLSKSKIQEIRQNMPVQVISLPAFSVFYSVVIFLVF